MRSGAPFPCMAKLRRIGCLDAFALPAVLSNASTSAVGRKGGCANGFGEKSEDKAVGLARSG